ncbi:MAG: ParA family protein [Candidatus Njordarchaeia archaeon]
MPNRGTVISFVNWKGGVGKTTSVVNVAAELAHHRRKNVLVIDIDPQGTSSFYLYGKKRYEREYYASIVNELRQGKSEEAVKQSIISRSSYGLILSAFDSSERIFNYEEGIKRGVAKIRGLDLVPSTHYLVELTSNITLKSMTEGVPSFGWLDRSLDLFNLREKYDFIIIDCPPNLDVGTQNAVFASDFYIIPTIPDALSTAGIPLLIRNIYKVKKRKREMCNRDPKLMGILLTRVSYQLRAVQRGWIEEFIPWMLDGFKRDKLVWSKAKIFNTFIKEAVSVPKAAGESKPLCVSNQRSSQSTSEYASLANEILSYLKLYGDEQV